MSLLIVFQFEAIGQNKQNKYYKPIRFFINGGGKIPLESTSEFNYDFGAGANFGIVYTLNQTASLELSAKSGLTILYNSSNNNSANMIPFTLGVDFYLYDKDFSPYFGIRPGINFIDNSIEPSVSGEIGISYKKMKLYGAGHRPRVCVSNALVLIARPLKRKDYSIIINIMVCYLLIL